MLTSATVSIFRLTCSCCPAVNLTGSVTSRQPSWTGQKTHHTWPSTSRCLRICRSNRMARLNLCVLYYLAERRIWRCVSLSQWHLNSETRTTWLHSTVRFFFFKKKLAFFSRFPVWAHPPSSIKVNSFSVWALSVYGLSTFTPFHMSTHKTHIHTLCTPLPALSDCLSSPAH